MEKKKISLPIIVEGKYDKTTLTSMFDCTVILHRFVKWRPPKNRLVVSWTLLYRN